MRLPDHRSTRRAARLSYELARLRLGVLRAAAGSAVFAFCEHHVFGATNVSHMALFFATCALLDWWGYPIRLAQRVVRGRD